MTGSKEGHKRYVISKQLKELVGENVRILLCNGENQMFFFKEPHKLEFHEQEGSYNARFYCVRRQIPTRSVKRVNLDSDFPEIVLDISYLGNYRGART